MTMLKLGLSMLFAAIVSAKDGNDFNDAAYLSSSRQAKSDKIWNRVIESSTSGSWTHLAGALLVDQAPVFDTVGDELACYWNGCRNKTIHIQGVVSKIEWISSDDHPYTGMFKGSDAGYIRMSSAKPVVPFSNSLAPGMGVKLLRDGKDSANFVAMYSVDGQDSLNWFANDFTNHIPTPQSASLKPLLARFATETELIQTVGLSEMAGTDQYGNSENSNVFPWSLRFSPTGEFDFPSTAAERSSSWIDDLKSIPSGSILYKIYAMDKPAELGGTESYIGEI